MSPVDVASDAPDAEAPRLCSASSRRNAVGIERHLSLAGRRCGGAHPANAGSGRPGTSTGIANRPPE